MSRSQQKRRQKCRTTKQYCQEKLCCPDPITEAAYFCNDCGSAQCQQCEKDIHSRKVSFEFHDRRIIESPPDDLVCQAKLLNFQCKDRNFADIWCENCQLAFCFDCHSECHRTKKQQHIGVSFAHFQKREKEIKAQAAEVLEPSTLLRIKPSSPLAAGDDSLTFCSFPQEQFALQQNPSTASKSFPDHIDTENFMSTRMSFQSTTSAHSNGSSGGMPDICPEGELDLVTSQLAEAGVDVDHGDGSIYDDPEGTNISRTCPKDFLLVDDNEAFQVKDEDSFLELLGCSREARVKVVSIFGNTGDGKSHTLNNAFFDGKEVFKTSACQSSCTVGVWAALDRRSEVIVIDTEGLLGSSGNDNKRTRLLLKVLAISDVAVFRTRAERLHSDMFDFLSNASKAYKQHFYEDLQAAAQRFQIKESNLGPILVIFQETNHTQPLQGEKSRRADACLRDLFKKHKCSAEAFSEIRYIGTQTTHPPTDFTALKNVLAETLKNNSVRAPRKPGIVFQSLKVLNDKFSGNLESSKRDTFPEEYFTCTSKCLACGSRCVCTVNHDTSHQPHDAGRDKACHYENQFGNKVYLCKKCFLKGRKNVVVPKTSEASDNALFGFTKYILSGYVLECPTCGVIYRSREHWYGNPEPDSAVQVEVRHLWPEGVRALSGTQNAGRKFVEGVSFVASAVSTISAKPVKAIGEWTADQVAPQYWEPNSKIRACKLCSCPFTEEAAKHHCRACGSGVCDECSSNRRLVPERGWSSEPVRVCDACHRGNTPEFAGQEEAGQQVTARKVGEVVSTAVGYLRSTLVDYPTNVVKDASRPDYWVPDEEISACCVCQLEFSPKRRIHHCRMCGQGVCSTCSPHKKEVPLRGWDEPVRVCVTCENTDMVL